MSDCIVVFERVDNTTITASAGDDSSNPSSNLKDGRYATKWVSDDDLNGQTLQFVFPVARKVTSALFANHNFNSLGADTVELEYHNGTSWVSLGSLVLADEPIYFSGFDQTRTQFRLKFNRAAGRLGTEPFLGMAFLGQEAQLPIYLNNPKRGLKADIVRDESLSGLKFRASAADPRETWRIEFGALRSAKNAELWRWWKGIGVGLHPFWFRDMDEHWHFVGADMDAVDSAGLGNASFKWANILLSEERVGQTTKLPGGYTV